MASAGVVVMVAPLPTVTRDEPEIRLRRGLFGKLLVQVRYQTFSTDLALDPSRRKPIGMTAWRDACADDICEVVAVVVALGAVAADHPSRVGHCTGGIALKKP